MKFSLRRSGLYWMAFAATLAMGFVSRHLYFPVPAWLGKYAGDALWATMIYFGLRAVRPDATRYRSVATCLAFCLAIEVLKLCHAPWLDSVRGTSLGRLVFGYAFSWRNLLAYALGTGLGVTMDRRASVRLAYVKVD